MLIYININLDYKMASCKLKLGQYLKTQKKRSGEVRVLIVENMQNCFFNQGSLAFRSKSTQKEKEFVEKINRLINFVEVDDDYVKAGKSGKEPSKKTRQSTTFDTGARKKYYFDMVVFTQIANPPDHFSFASSHYLKDPTKFNYFSSNSPGIKYVKSSKKIKTDKKKLFLLPDYALTDGGDSYLHQGKMVKGIDFHPDLDTSCLQRPNDDLHTNVFINSPRYYNRGYILTKGNDFSNNHSAFLNSDLKSTGLEDFLKCNYVNCMYVCGMGRENQVYQTMMDSLKLNFLKDRFVIHDATEPINIDLSSFKNKAKRFQSMKSDSIEDNPFLEEYRDQGISVLNSQNLFTYFDRLNGKINLNKVGRMESLGSLFQSSQKSSNNVDNAINNIFNLKGKGRTLKKKIKKSKVRNKSNKYRKSKTPKKSRKRKL